METKGEEAERPVKRVRFTDRDGEGIKDTDREDTTMGWSTFTTRLCVFGSWQGNARGYYR